jgi:hypothetical protein
MLPRYISTLLDEEARFDAPAVAGTEVAALMDIVLAERLAGEPGVAGCFGDGPCPSGNLA